MDEPVKERVSGNAARGKRRIKAIRTLTDIKISPAPPTDKTTTSPGSCGLLQL
jgi:hypothetical protein